jgi:hypothetical protein
MKELVRRLAALDPAAGAAVKVIAYFDQLVDGRAGLESIVRGAAALAGCPARLADDDHRVHIRILADGRRGDDQVVLDPAWPGVAVTPGGPPVLWLERPGPLDPVHAMVLERAAAAVRVVLERTRRTAAAQPVDDPASVEVVLDASAPRHTRVHAARRLGLDPTMRARAVALEGGKPLVVAAHPGATILPVADRRAGIGPAVAVADLPASWAAARTALRLTAEGTERDPGPRVVYAEDLGGLAVLAAAVGPGTEPSPDVRALERARSTAP